MSLMKYKSNKTVKKARVDYNLSLGACWAASCLYVGYDTRGNQDLPLLIGGTWNLGSTGGNEKNENVDKAKELCVCSKRNRIFGIYNRKRRNQMNQVKAIIKWPTPRNVAEVRSFLRSTSQLRRFKKDHAKVAAPLTDLTKEKVKWKWQQEGQESLERLKEATAEEPVLRLFDYEAEETTIEAGKGLKTVLKQKDKTGKEYVDEYYSKKLSEAEQKYTNPDRELHAIMKAFEKWHPYLYGRKKIVKMDLNNIKFFLKKQKINTVGFEIVRIRLRDTACCEETKRISRLESKTWLYGRETEKPETEIRRR